MRIKIKPCTECGGCGILTHVIRAPKFLDGWAVMCADCRRSGDVALAPHTAIMKWNEREGRTEVDRKGICKNG